MLFKYLNKISFKPNSSIREVLERFDETSILTESSGFAVILDEKNRCLGVVTDGDIRRKLTSGFSIDSKVVEALNKNFAFVSEKDGAHKILRQFDKRVFNLPVLDEDGKLVDLYQYSNFVASSRTEQRIIRARVPVRVSYSGGGTDMSNFINKSKAAVLSSTINKYCTASIIVREDEQIHIRSKDLNLSYEAASLGKLSFGDELDLLKAAIKIMQPNYGFDLETNAEFSPGTGLGGSSAVVSSVLGALNYFRNEQQLDIYELSDLAYQVERIDMGIKGGWQDQYATIFGGFSWIEFRKNEVVVNPLKLRRDTLLELEYNLMLFRLGGSRSSSEIQELYNEDIEDNLHKHKLFEDMISLAYKMKDALLKGGVKAFGDLLDASWNLKQKMNGRVSNPFVAECYKTAREIGALGGKLLGAGGSGYLLLYASPKFHRKIKEELEQMGVQHEMFKFDQNGLEVWATKK